MAAAPSRSGSAAKASFFKARVSLHSQTLGTASQRLKLVAGMQVVAEIDQGSRSVMDYLLSPVKKTLNESGRER